MRPLRAHVSPEGAHSYSKRDRSSFDSGRQSCHMSIRHFYSIHRDGEISRGSCVLPDTMFNGGNMNLAFNANMPIWSLPYKNSLSTWTVCTTSSQLTCMLIGDNQSLPGIMATYKDLFPESAQAMAQVLDFFPKQAAHWSLRRKPCASEPAFLSASTPESSPPSLNPASSLGRPNLPCYSGPNLFRFWIPKVGLSLGTPGFQSSPREPAGVCLWPLPHNGLGASFPFSETPHLCVHPLKSSFFLSPSIWPLSSFVHPLPFWSPPFHCLYKFGPLLLFVLYPTYEWNHAVLVLFCLTFFT